MLPALRGLVRRRVLINYRVDPTIVERQLPAPFRPKLLGEWAIAGICLICLEQVRPKGIPAILGRSSENAAHRIAVTWTDETGTSREGVYIPRRETGSRLNHLVGGRLFPGDYRHAAFSIREPDDSLDLSLVTVDGKADVNLRVHPSPDLPASSHFASLADAARFFAAGEDSYSATRDGIRLDGLRMRAESWPFQILAVESLHSAYFANQSLFPAGSIQFDSALIVRDVEHEWHQLPDFCQDSGHPALSPSHSG